MARYPAAGSGRLGEKQVAGRRRQNLGDAVEGEPNAFMRAPHRVRIRRHGEAKGAAIAEAGVDAERNRAFLAAGRLVFRVECRELFLGDPGIAVSPRVSGSGTETLPLARRRILEQKSRLRRGGKLVQGVPPDSSCGTFAQTRMRTAGRRTNTPALARRRFAEPRIRSRNRT